MCKLDECISTVLEGTCLERSSAEVFTQMFVAAVWEGKVMANRLAVCTSIALAMFVFQAPCLASNSSPGNIVGITSERTGALLFNQTGSRTSRPSCSTVDRWAIDTSTLAGQSMAGVLLTAFSQNKTIFVYGTGNCSAWADTETVEYFTIN